MFRKLLALLLINGLMLQPVQQVVQPLYASESPVRLASVGSEPEAAPFLEVAEADPLSAEQEEVEDAPALEAATTEELGLAVSVGFADSATPSADFPIPWQGAPNVVYIGGGDPVNAGAIRLDNHSGAPLPIDRVEVDLQRSNARFSLWQGFTIPANGSAILTQTAPGNFDTSAYPIAPCGGTLPAGEARIPKITVTSGASFVTLLDSAHVLDTGGFDSSCRGNESVQWREIGTRGIEAPSGELTLGPSNSTGSGGSPVTLRAHLQDANGAPLPNVVVELRAVSGPNADESRQAVTDNQGNARFTYVGTAQGADIVRATVTNASRAPVQSNDVTVTWETAACGPDVPLPPGDEATLLYTGGTRVQHSDPIELAALLSDPLGEPAAGRMLRFSFGGQTYQAATDSTGIARVAVTAAAAPAQVPATVDFAGGSGLPALRATQTVVIEREDALLEYTAKTLLGTAVPQPVSARLRDPDSLAPIAGRTVTFNVGTVIATAVTDANGVAAAAITLGPNQMSGPSSLTVSFAGDAFYKPAVRTVEITIYLSTSFVIWGGNDAGLKLGQRVNFWGSQWESQVLQGEYHTNPSFKGLADPISQIHVCQPNATPQGLTPTCWISKGGQTWPPPISVPAYIEVIVSTVIARQGSDIYGNIAAAAVVKVDPQPPYGPDPGKPGYGVIVAVIEDTDIFPAPAAVTATQTQPRTVLPNEQITVAATISNTSTATAATGVVLTEKLDGLSPATGSETLGTIAPGTSRTVEFQAVTPGIPTRENSESAADYIQRLSSLNGRVYTSTGKVTFSDSNGQVYLPVEVSSRSVLAIPILTLSLSGPAVASPGSPTPYKVMVTNIGSAPATATVELTMPDGTPRTFEVSDLAAGSSFTQIETFTPPAIEPKGENETTAAYLARLANADGELLTTTAEVAWSDADGNLYGDVGQRIFTSRIRVPILEFTAQTPATLLPGQTSTVNLAVRNTGGCTAVLSDFLVTNPDGSTTSASPFVLAANESTTVATSWQVPLVPKRDDDNETDAQYLARLQAADGTDLDFQIALDWSDPAGAVTYGPTSASTRSRKIISIVPVTLSGPATATAGSTATYTITATNVGSAAAPEIDLTVLLPNGSVQTPAVGSLAPGATFQATIDYAIPTTQAAGVIQADAAIQWTDPGYNAYGPLSAAASTEVTNATVFNSLALSPAIAGPNVTGTSQTLTATLKDSAGAPIPNATVQFDVTGVNPTSGAGTTDAAGIAAFTYSGANAGADTIQATSGTAVSNTASVNWIKPVQSVSTTPMFARFFASDGSGTFNIPATATPAFIQAFPTINFNPPRGTIPGNTSGVGTSTRPFTNVTTDLNGNFTGTIVAQGNARQAGSGSLFNFQAVFTGSLIVASAGDMIIDVFSDDGFVLGIGGGATRVSGPMFNVPAGGVTEFEKLPVVGAYNAGSGPVGRRVVVRFPAPGTYSYEVDYSECCSGELALTVAAGNVTGRGVAPTGSLKLGPINPAAKPTGNSQTFTVDAFDGSGAPVANAGLALVINGPNGREISATTDASGRATFTYTGNRAGTDSVQAIGRVAGLATFSNLVNVNWTPGPGGGEDPGQPGGNIGPIVTQGWIAGPLHGSTLQVPTPINTAQVSIYGGILDFWPTSNPAEIRVLNPNVSIGTIGTFDPTVLANGEYTIRLRAEGNGTQLTSLVTVNVTGDNKPGRVTFEVKDLEVPVAGMPVTIARRYDSLERGKVGDFGYGWSLQTSVRLEVSKKNDVTFNLNGRRQTFRFSPQSGPFPFPFLLTPKWVPDAGTFGTLTSDGCGALTYSGGTFSCLLDVPGSFAPSTYTYTDPYGRQYVMGRDGQIKSIKDLNGNMLTFTPNGITSSMGGLTVPFVRDAQGRITQITDPEGKTFLYTYDAAGDLASVQLPDIETPVRYEYATGHYFLKGIDARGNPEATTTYYADGRLQSVTDAMGKTTTYSYDLATRTTRITHPDNTGTTIERYDAQGLLLSTTDPLGRTTSYTYDANLNKRTETDALGKTTTYDYDANGNLKSVTDPLNKTKRIALNGFGQPLTTTDQLGKIRTLTYDDSHNLSSISDELGVQMAFTWNERANPLTFTNANGKVARFTYDAYGNILSKADPLGRATSYTYDTMGRALTMTDARGVTRFSYDALGRMLSVIDPLSNETRYEYDANGNQTAVIDAKGRTTRYEYDAANRVSKITLPDETTLSYTYNFRGQEETETVTGPAAAGAEPFSRTTTYRYDNAGQLVRIIHPDLSEMKLAYDAVGRTKTVTDELNRDFTYEYDPACGCRDRLAKIIDPNGNSIIYTYDAAGRRISFTDAANRETRYTYDVRNRLTKTTFADNTFEQTTFDGLGRPLTSIDQEGRVTTFAYDDVGNLLSVTDPQGATTQYAYDALNNLLSSLDANGRTTRFEYDAINRVIKRVLPLGMEELYTYDQVGNLATRTDFKGKKTTYEFDSMNRLTARRPDASLGEPAVLYSYTETGKRRSMIDASGTTTYTYDQRDRLIIKQTPQGILTYGYDLTGGLTSMRSSNADGVSVNYTYDSLYRLEEVIDNRLAAGTTTYTYDVVGNLKSDLRPNGVRADYIYDTLNRLTNLGITREGTTQASYAYTLDRTGRRLSVTEHGGRTVNYTYDAVYRLTREAVSGSQNSAGNGAVDYTYDPVGNRLARISSLEGVLSSTSAYDANDRLLSDAYDANGNATSADGRTYVYDFENRVKSANDGAVRITYDGDGNLAAKTVGGVTTQYLVDDLNPTGYSQVVEEIVNGQVQRQYTFGHMILSQRLRLADGWTVSFYSTDGHGSVRQLTDQTGAVTDTYTYDAFGKLISRTGTTPNPYLYAGERFDQDLGLYHLRARHYNTDRGRFVSMDPYPGETDDPVSLHKYLYANADPVNFIDPSGLSATEEGIFSKLATRWAPAAYIVGRAIACVLITNASTIASELGYAEWVEVAALAEALALIPCLRYPGPKPPRRIPNPGGSLGGPAHRDKVKQVADELERRGYRITNGGGRGLPEERLPVPGRPAGRRPDITATKDGRTVRVQVGKQTKGRRPVARERDALGDIRGVQEPGDHTIFIPYN